MTGNIDRNLVRSAFSGQANEYDRHAVVQKRVVQRFIELLQSDASPPSRILDVGAGTGMLLAAMDGIYPEAFKVGMDLAMGMCGAARLNPGGAGARAIVCADAESLPFGAASFDLVLSTSTFQWLETLDNAFSEAFRVLAPGGLFRFALFGERTLFELKGSYRRALEMAGRVAEDRTHRFFSAVEAESALKRAGFGGCGAFSELEAEMHSDVPALLRSIKRIGAGNAAPNHSKSLAHRRVMLDMMDIYRREYAADGLIPATYEVIYGAGRKR